MTDEKDFSLLETIEPGSSIFELIEFSLTRTVGKNNDVDGLYGVNVAKVREVIRMPKINPLASRIKGIAGIFELRGIPIPAINLRKVLGDEKAEITDDQQIIIVECSNKRAGFIVSQTHRIRRVNWNKVLSPSADEASYITGMILVDENEFLFILDLEKILSTLEELAKNGSHLNASDNILSSASSGDLPMEEEDSQVDGPSAGVLLVDDSPFILNNTKKALVKAGYRVITAQNGKEAFDLLNQYVNSDITEDNAIDIIITDVEMPQMDGLTLIQKIKNDPSLDLFPIILHSSLGGKAVQASGEKVGADRYVVKSNLSNLIKAVNELLDMSGEGSLSA